MEDTKTIEEKSKTVVAALLDLPSDESRLAVMSAVLEYLMLNRADGIVKEWLQQANDSIMAAIKLWNRQGA